MSTTITPMPFLPVWVIVIAIVWLCIPIAKTVFESGLRWWWIAPVAIVQLAAIGVTSATLAAAGTYVIMAVQHAQAIEARRAATGTGAVHESAVPKGCAQPESGA